MSVHVSVMCLACVCPCVMCLLRVCPCVMCLLCVCPYVCHVFVTCLSMCLFTCLSRVYPCVMCLICVSLYVCHVFVMCLSICLSYVCYVSVHVSVMCLSTCLSICPSVCLQLLCYLPERFQYLPREYTQDDEQEDEEDAEAEIPIDERVDDDDEQDEDAALKDRKPWGETRHYCPVALQEQAILWPGNPELACKYKERVYQFSTQESKDKFMRDPTAYLPSVDPIKLPPLRLLILGAKGAGKTEQGRTVAKELGIFHIDFCERLQEMIIEKTGKRVNREEGAEQVEEDESAEDKPELTEDEEAIQSYLSHDVPLAESQLISIIKPWWHEEPLKSTGFVLEGIPNTPDEMQMMANEGLFADMAVMLTIQEKDVINRLLPGRVARWRAKRDERVAKREKERKERMKERVGNEKKCINGWWC